MADKSTQQAPVYQQRQQQHIGQIPAVAHQTPLHQQNTSQNHVIPEPHSEKNHAVPQQATVNQQPARHQQSVSSPPFSK